MHSHCLWPLDTCQVLSDAAVAIHADDGSAVGLAQAGSTCEDEFVAVLTLMRCGLVIPCVQPTMHIENVHMTQYRCVR
jgi:hypothetical protein